MITIRAGHHDLNRVAELLGVAGTACRVGGISEERGVTVEFNAGSKSGLPLWRRLLPSASIRVHHLECSDRDVRFELKELSVGGWALPGWTVKTGMRIIRSERVQQWMFKDDHPFEINSAAEITLVLDKLKEQLRLPFDFQVSKITFGTGEVTVKLTVTPPADQNGI